MATKHFPACRSALYGTRRLLSGRKERARFGPAPRISGCAASMRLFLLLLRMSAFVAWLEVEAPPL